MHSDGSPNASSVAQRHDWLPMALALAPLLCAHVWTHRDLLGLLCAPRKAAYLCSSLLPPSLGLAHSSAFGPGMWICGQIPSPGKRSCRAPAHGRYKRQVPAKARYSAAPGSRKGFVASSSVPAVGETIITAVPRHTCRQCKSHVSAHALPLNNSCVTLTELLIKGQKRHNVSLPAAHHEAQGARLVCDPQRVVFVCRRKDSLLCSQRTPRQPVS